MQGYHRTYDVSGNGEEEAEIMHHDDTDQPVEKESEEEHVSQKRAWEKGRGHEAQESEEKAAWE